MFANRRQKGTRPVLSGILGDSGEPLGQKCADTDSLPSISPAGGLRVSSSLTKRRGAIGGVASPSSVASATHDHDSLPPEASSPSLRPARPIPASPNRHLHYATPESMPLDDIMSMKEFIHTPADPDTWFQCTVIRDKRGSVFRKETCFFMFSEATRAFMMAAKDRKFQSRTNVLFSLDRDDLDRSSSSYIGKLRQIAFSRSFILYDNGTNPEKLRARLKSLNKTDEQISSMLAVDSRRELALFEFLRGATSGFLAAREPGVAHAFIPREGELFQPLEVTAEDSMSQTRQETLCEERLIRFDTQKPEWCEETDTYSLDFGGRVIEGSVKNIQFKIAGSEDQLVFQFGRTGPDSFILDFKGPLTPFQAFALGVSVFCS